MLPEECIHALGTGNSDSGLAPLAGLKCVLKLTYPAPLRYNVADFQHTNGPTDGRD